jgi:hypothetical protein
MVKTILKGTAMAESYSAAASAVSEVMVLCAMIDAHKKESAW